MLSTPRAFFLLVAVFVICLGIVDSAPLRQYSRAEAAFTPRWDDPIAYRPLSSRAKSERSLADGIDLWKQRELNGEELFDLKRYPSSEEISERDALERRNIFKKIGEGFKKMGNGIKKAAQKVGEGVKKAAQKVGEGVKTAAQKVASGVKTAVKKTGEFMKENGAKLGKVILKGVSTVQKIGAQVAKYIPIIGKPLSMGLQAASMGTNIASDKIKANMNGGWGKALNTMSTVRKFSSPTGALKSAAGGKGGGIASEIADIVGREYEGFEELSARDFDADSFFERYLDEEDGF